MGLFGNKTREALEYLEHELEEDEIRWQIMAMVTFMSIIAALRLLSYTRVKASLEGEHHLSLHALNDAICHKEVFLAYLQAAILEPVLSVVGMEEVKGQELLINVFTLGSIFWWIWMVTDAFDYADIMQNFTYQVNLREEMEDSANSSKQRRKELSWLVLANRDEDAVVERQTLIGSLRRDVALWFMMACIIAAWMPGRVTHRDVMHAYVVIVLWAILHHHCRKTTVWNTE